MSASRQSTSTSASSHPSSSSSSGGQLIPADDPENETHPPPSSVSSSSYIPSMERYTALYQRSIQQPDAFWADMARETLRWSTPFTVSRRGELSEGNVDWFVDGETNACDNCIDRWAERRPDRTAIVWESDDGGETKKVSFSQLRDDVSRLANALKRRGVRKGDRVAIYMPMVPEAAVAMLACARLGAIHSVVFAGFSSDALRDRVVDAQCSVVITADEGKRGGKRVPLKPVVDKAVEGLTVVRSVLVFRNTGAKVPMKQGRDEWYHTAVNAESTHCPCEVMKATDPLFMLYTSGSTGKPKGLVHTTAGYLTYAAVSAKYVFDLHDTDRYACVADVGWITGHSYIVYGPLCLGQTTFMFEGVPTSPSPSRFWEMIERHRLNVFYTSPTTVRTLMKFGSEPVHKSDLSSLRVLGSVGEPINPEAWRWLYHEVGGDQCSIVDTFWQTETGGIVLTPLPGATPEKPGSCTFPFFGIVPSLLDDSGRVLQGNDVQGLLCIDRPWPGMARTIYNDHRRFVQTYLTQHKGRYVTGDGARRDRDGYYWITGRVDDVMNVSGHRIGSAEVESALVLHEAVSEAAVIGVKHDIKGQGLVCFVIQKMANAVKSEAQLRSELRQLIRVQIGPFAAPELVVVSRDLPKTRSGKIMRRLLRKIAEGEEDLGDTSTLADESVVQRLMEDVKRAKEGAKGQGKAGGAPRSKL